MKRFPLYIGSFLTVLLAGCASYPEEQLKLAQTAMDQATEQRAQAFASGDWEIAKKAWDEAQEQLGKQQYALAASKLLTAKSRFEKARDIAQAKRDTLLKELKDTQHAINVRLGNLKVDMGSARMSAAVRTRLEAALGEIDQAAEKLRGEIDNGEYLDARNTAKETLVKINGAEKQLDAVARRRS